MNCLQNAGPAPSPIGQMPPNDGMPGGPMPPAFFPVSVFTYFISSYSVLISLVFYDLYLQYKKKIDDSYLLQIICHI